MDGTRSAWSPWPAGGGEMGERIRRFDWATTPLGPVACWPPHLRTAVELMLASSLPGSIHAGRESIMLYNDGWADLIGIHHPAALGVSSLETFASQRAEFAPIVERVWAGETVHLADVPVSLPSLLPHAERWFTVTHLPLRDGSGHVDGLFVIGVESTERRLAESTLRASEARQAFLLRLGDVLRPLVDPIEVQCRATHALGEHLGAGRVGFARTSDDGLWIEVTHAYASGVPSIEGRHDFASFGPALLRVLRAGRTVIRGDVANDPTLTEEERAYRAALQIGAVVTVPLIEAGRLIAVLFVHHAAAHAWTSDEIALLEESAERIWAEVERAVAESALRASEERYRTLFDAIDEGFQLAEIVFDEQGEPVDYRLLEVNAGFGRMTGVNLESVIGRTARELVPEMDRSWIETYARVAMHGESIRFERYEPALDRWFDVYAMPVGSPGTGLFSIVFRDITGRIRREANAAFLGRLSQELEHESTGAELLAVAGERICAYLGVDRCYFAEMDDASGTGFVFHDAHASRLKSVSRAEPYRVSDYFPHELCMAIQAGETIAVSDVASDPRLAPEHAEALKHRAHLIAPLIADGHWRFAVGVASEQPRVWSAGQIELVREIAARIWFRLERTRAAEALRASEEQYRSLFETMDEGFALCEIIRDNAGDAVSVRSLQVNPAFEHLTGISCEQLLCRGGAAADALPWHGLRNRIEGVVRTGEAARLEHPIGDRWFEVGIFPRGGDRFAMLCADISARKEAEATLEAAAARDALRLTLSDLLRTLSDPAEIKGEAARMLGQHLGVHRAGYLEIEGPDCVTHRLYSQQDDDFPLRFPMASTTPSFLDRYLRGEPVVINDLHADPGLTRAERDEIGAGGVVAFVGVPLLKRGVLVGGFRVHSTTPRVWTDAEVELIREVAERIWAAVEHVRAQAELRAREAELQLITNNAPALIGWVDRDLRYRFVNDPACHYFGLPREQIIGRTAADVIGQELVDRLLPGMERALRGEPVYLDMVVPSPDGTGDRVIEERFVPRVAVDGGVDGYYFLALDVTEHRRALNELRRGEERFSAIAHLVPDLLWSNDPFGKATWHNQRWHEYTGLPAEHGLEDGWLETIHPDDRESSRERMLAALSRGDTLLQEHRIRRHDGVYRWFLERAEPVRDESGKIVSWFGAATDIHDARVARDELEQRVAAATAELRTLSRRLIEVQEEERRHLARELHDEIGQVLTGLGFQLGTGRPIDAARLSEARGIVAELTEQVRQLSMDLRPSALDAYGLLPSLAWHIERFEKRTGVQVDLRHEGLDRRFAAPVEVTAYRVVQEALTNVARHAGVPLAVVQLLADDATLTVSVRDAGRGFDGARTAAGSGLGGMRERAELLGGTLTIDTRPGGGVVLTAELPLFEPELDEEAR